jgi:hypothetical protein
MNTKRNVFGGKNANSVYVPMSETEQEVIQRLVETHELLIMVHGWGVVDHPKLTVGDAQVMIPITLRFDRPEFPIPVKYFDLELRTLSGISLFREQQPTMYDGMPLMISAGVEIQMIWHIGIKCMDPRLVKMILPGAIGLTSRIIDKDSGNQTQIGNMKLDSAVVRTLNSVRQGEARVRARKLKRINGGK